jgi:hypothetical protein
MTPARNRGGPAGFSIEMSRSKVVLGVLLTAGLGAACALRTSQPRREAEGVTTRQIEVAGMIEVLEADGRRTRPHQGTITLWPRFNLSWHPQTIPIVEGQWSAPLPNPFTCVDVGRVVVDGREAYVHVDSHECISGMEPATWIANLAQPVLLRVVDAATNTAVADFEVREWGTGWDKGVPPLGPDQGWTVVARATGSIPLPAWSLNPAPSFIPGVRWTPHRTFWVRAAGRAWSQVEADFDQGGQVVARLVPSASLRVVLDPRTRVAIDPDQPLLEVAIHGGTAWRSLEFLENEIEFESLPAGEVTLRWRADTKTGGEQREVAVRTVALSEGRQKVVQM